MKVWLKFLLDIEIGELGSHNLMIFTFHSAENLHIFPYRMTALTGSLHLKLLLI